MKEDTDCVECAEHEPELRRGAACVGSVRAARLAFFGVVLCAALAAQGASRIVYGDNPGWTPVPGLRLKHFVGEFSDDGRTLPRLYAGGQGGIAYQGPIAGRLVMPVTEESGDVRYVLVVELVAWIEFEYAYVPHAVEGESLHDEYNLVLDANPRTSGDRKVFRPDQLKVVSQGQTEINTVRAEIHKGKGRSPTITNTPGNAATGELIGSIEFSPGKSILRVEEGGDLALSMRMADETVQGRSNVRQGASDAASRRALLVPVPINLNTSVERDEESAGLKIYSGEFSNCGRIVDRTYESLIKSTCGETGVLDLFAEGRLYAPLNGTRARVFLIDMDAARTSAPRQAVSAETEDYGVPVEDPHLPPQLSFVLNPINEGFVFANATMKWDSRRYSIWTEGGGEHPFSLVPEGAGKRAGQPRRLVVYSGGFNIMSSRD